MKPTIPFNNGLWMVVPEKKLKTRLKLYTEGEDPKGFKGEPFTYDATTGLYIQHRWDSSQGRWLDVITGWYQDSWPRAFVNACPDLKLPADLPINEKQTSLDWYELKEQDPDAIIKNFKPGFAEDSQWQPETQPSNEFKQFVYSNDGYILKDSDGVSYTINEKRQQLWRLNAKLETVDVAQLSIENGVMLIDWNSGAEQRFEIGTPIPLTPTKTRHPAFAFTDWLQTQDALTVGFAQWPSFSIQFMADNNILGAPTEHAPVSGKWYHDAQDILISVTGPTGDSKVITHPWKDVAKQTTWPVASSLK